MHGLAQCFTVRERAFRYLRNRRRRSVWGEKQSLEFRHRGLRVDAAPVSGEERVPSLERPEPAGNRIVQFLVGRPCTHRLTRNNRRFRLWRCEGLMDGVILEAHRLMQVRLLGVKARREPQGQNDRIIENRFHGTRPAPPPPAPQSPKKSKLPRRGAARQFKSRATRNPFA